MLDETVDPVEVGFVISFAYLLHTGIVLAFYAIVWWFWGDRFIVEFADLWHALPAGEVAKGLLSVWFIFVWAITANFLSGYINIDETRSTEPKTVFGLGLWISLNAGVFEELIYRWMLFFISMVTLPFMNWLTFGFIKWLYTELLIPLANWSTFGALEPQLLSSNWVLGAAVVSAAASFRNAHKYQGFFGYVNAWFLGMVFFYLLFNYGMLTAMLAHFLYDAAIFATAAIMMSFRPRQRKHRFFA